MNSTFRKLTVVAAMSALLAATGCVHPNGEPNNTASGALIGAGGGAAFGAALGAIGGGGRGAAAGALLGGAFGAITGTLIGNQMDQDQEAQLRAQAPVTYVHVQQNQPLTVADVQALVGAKVSDDAIIAQIQNSHTVYHLAAGDIIALHNAGVSDRVVNYMINTPNTVTPAPSTPTEVVNSDEPPPVAADTVAPAPGPGYVWVGGEWRWNGMGWVWSNGYWATPPWGGAVWIRGYWYRGPFGGWRHAPGHWR